MRSLALVVAGTATRFTASKFLRDSSSFQVVLPGESGCKRSGVPAAWHETHRAWPGRFARKMGSILVLNTSKSSDVDAPEEEAGAWLGSPAIIKAQQTTIVYTRPPQLS